MPAATYVEKSKRSLEQAPLPKSSDYKQYSVTGEPNVQLVVYPSGERVLRFRRKMRTGKLNKNGTVEYKYQHKKFGRLEDIEDLKTAWQHAKKLRAMTADEVFPDSRKTKNEPAPMTVRELIEEWRDKELNVGRKAKSTIVDYENVIKLYLDPRLGDGPNEAEQELVAVSIANIQASELRRGDVNRLLDQIIRNGRDGKGTTSRADRTRVLLSNIYTWAIRRDMYGIEVNPADNIKSVHKKDLNTRHRLLTKAEIKQLWSAVNSPLVQKRSPERTVLFRLLALTGQRLNEVVETSIDEFKFDDQGLATWTLPAARTKNKKEAILPLGPYASTLWREAIDTYGDGKSVFPPRRGDSSSPFIATSVVSHSLEPLRKFFKLDVTVHSLRHTARTFMAQLKIPSDISRLCLNHKPGNSRDVHEVVYNHWEYIDEMREAFTKLEGHILEIVGERPETKPDARPEWMIR